MIIIISAFLLTLFCLLAAGTIASLLIPLLAKKSKWINDPDKTDIE